MVALSYSEFDDSQIDVKINPIVEGSQRVKLDIRYDKLLPFKIQLFNFDDDVTVIPQSVRGLEIIASNYADHNQYTFVRLIIHSDPVRDVLDMIQAAFTRGLLAAKPPPGKWVPMDAARVIRPICARESFLGLEQSILSVNINSGDGAGRTRVYRVQRRGNTIPRRDWEEVDVTCIASATRVIPIVTFSSTAACDGVTIKANATELLIVE